MKRRAPDTDESSHSAATADLPWASREELITRGLTLVRRIAFQLARRLPSHVELSDLISAGTVGMLHAVQAFETARTLHFEPYAKMRIRGAMIDELRANDLLSRHGRSQISEIHDARSALWQELGRAPDDEEVAARLGLPLGEYQRLNGELTRRPVLIRLSNAPVCQPRLSSAPEAALCDKDLKQHLASAIARLPAREQRIVRLYYQEGQTQAAVGALLGVSEARISQLLTQATARLRSILEQAPREPTLPPRASARVRRKFTRRPS